jgi:hypothetical protein
MKLAYRFPAIGHLRLKSSVPLEHLGCVFGFELDENQAVTHLSVTIPVAPTDIPTVTKNPKSGVKLQLNMVSPGIEKIIPLVRTLEGFLSMFGIESIETQDIQLRWLPETPEEKASLQVFDFSVGRHKPKITDYEPLDFAYAGQAVVGIEALTRYEVPLNFYRRGMLDVRDKRFIDAYFDFYFILESLCADGKFKTRQVQNVFRASPTLQEAIAAALEAESFRSALRAEPKLLPSFNTHYLGRTSGEISDRFVELRGKLHHHSTKDKNAWHPAKQDEYHLDALILGHVCFEFLQKATMKTIYNDEVALKFKAAAGRAQTGKPL